MFVRKLSAAAAFIAPRLAIAAMALQLLLSFAHIHPLPSHGAAISENRPSAPIDSKDLADHDCAICANIAAFAATALPPPLYIRLPILAVRRILLPQQRTAPKPSFFRLFRSRAPPNS